MTVLLTASVTVPVMAPGLGGRAKSCVTLAPAATATARLALPCPLAAAVSV